MKHIRSGVAALALFVLAGAASAVTVTPMAPGFLGTFGPGMYQITGTGTVDLAGLAPGLEGTFVLKPDGTPLTAVTTTAQYGIDFNFDGADFDYLDSNNNGPAGPGRNIGALVGSFTATPSSPSQFFLIGNSTTITLTSTQSIFAFVNDNFPSNSNGSFDATISAVSAVPEPAQAALLLAGLGVVAMVGRRRSRTR